MPSPGTPNTESAQPSAVEVARRHGRSGRCRQTPVCQSTPLKTLFLNILREHRVRVVRDIRDAVELIRVGDAEQWLADQDLVLGLALKGADVAGCERRRVLTSPVV